MGVCQADNECTNSDRSDSTHSFQFKVKSQKEGVSKTQTKYLSPP